MSWHDPKPPVLPYWPTLTGLFLFVLVAGTVLWLILG
jgi:hypothetical protein